MQQLFMDFHVNREGQKNIRRITLKLTVEAIYDRVHNEDMLEFLAAKAE